MLTLGSLITPPLTSKKLILIIIGAFLLSLSLSGKASQLTLTWDKVSRKNISGYTLYYGESSGNYTHSIDVGDKAIHTIGGLKQGKTYYFAAKAYDQHHSEYSNFSAEIKAIIPYDEDSSKMEEKPGTSPEKASSQIAVSTAQFHNDSNQEKLDPQQAAQPPVVELGEININYNWTRIAFKEIFTNPIVIAKPLSYNEADPAIINIRNVDSTGFEARVQEWSYLDGAHALEKVGYLAIESGTYTLPNGTRLEASRYEANAEGVFTEITFLQGYQKIPVVITSIYGANSGVPFISRLKNISTEGFQVLFQPGEARKLNGISNSNGKTFSYIAWEPSAGVTNGVAFEINRTPNTVGHQFYPINYQQNFTKPPIFLADLQTTNNEGAANLRWRNKKLSSVEVKVDEAQPYGNSETEQVTESAGYALFGAASDIKE